MMYVHMYVLYAVVCTHASVHGMNVDYVILSHTQLTSSLLVEAIATIV